MAQVATVACSYLLVMECAPALQDASCVNQGANGVQMDVQAVPLSVSLAFLGVQGRSNGRLSLAPETGGSYTMQLVPLGMTLRD